jgi:hypothetical protein
MPQRSRGRRAHLKARTSGCCSTCVLSCCGAGGGDRSSAERALRRIRSLTQPAGAGIQVKGHEPPPDAAAAPAACTWPPALTRCTASLTPSSLRSCWSMSSVSCACHCAYEPRSRRIGPRGSLPAADCSGRRGTAVPRTGRAGPHPSQLVGGREGLQHQEVRLLLQRHRGRMSSGPPRAGWLAPPRRLWRVGAAVGIAGRAAGSHAQWARAAGGAPAGGRAGSGRAVVQSSSRALPDGRARPRQQQRQQLQHRRQQMVRWALVLRWLGWLVRVSLLLLLLPPSGLWAICRGRARDGCPKPRACPREGRGGEGRAQSAGTQARTRCGSSRSNCRASSPGPVSQADLPRSTRPPKAPATLDPRAFRRREPPPAPRPLPSSVLLAQ